jgi:hypothetical protein
VVRLIAVGVALLPLASSYMRIPLSRTNPFVLDLKPAAAALGLPPAVVDALPLTHSVPRLRWKKFVAMNRYAPIVTWRAQHLPLLNVTVQVPNIPKGKGWLETSRPDEFYSHAKRMAPQMSEPQIMVRGKGGIVDDFREAYWWLRDNTPEDARVMAWWDYGYQITGLSNRTTIADGNTWNHEHIALLGRCLVSSESEGHAIIRHLADYVLIWTTRYAGMSSDDLAKSPHMARIAGSVYRSIDPGAFWMDQSGNPSDMMRESVLFRLHHYGLDQKQGVTELKHFEEAYTSTNRMVRIFKVKKVSKKSKNHPFGSYPPKLSKYLEQAESFSEIKRRMRLQQGKFD